jgi:hypothetical protein
MSDADETSLKEVLVSETVKAAALARAELEGVALAAVVRDVLYAASLKAKPAPRGTVTKAARRPEGTKYGRIRFTVSDARYKIARDRIRASGKSVASALEAGLRDYAKTGHVN